MINIENWFYKYNIPTKYKILLVLAVLHNESKISDKKLKGQIQSLRKGELEKYKKTYHCSINNRWYNQVPALEVFEDCLKLTSRNIPFDKILYYIQLFENKGYNYSLNIFGREYIYNLYNEWNPEYTDKSFSDYIGFFIPNINITKESHFCYECGHTHYSFNKDSTKNIQTISEWLHTKKKGNLKKIPFFNIKTHFRKW